MRLKWWAEEIDSAKSLLLRKLSEVDSQEEKSRIEAKGRAEIAALEGASKRATKAAVFALCVSTYALIYGLQEAWVVVAMLVGAPYTIAHFRNKNRFLSAEEHGLLVTGKHREFRETFADAVWGNAYFGFICGFLIAVFKRGVSLE